MKASWLWLLIALVPALLLLPGVRAWLTRPAPAVARAVPVPTGAHEIAWFHTATNVAAWERFVTGVRLVVAQSADWQLRDEAAFPRDPQAVAEIVLHAPALGVTLHIRWYKLSSQARARDWVRALAHRAEPPLVCIGGDVSDRALDLANALAEQTEWPGPRPLLVFTTASADYLEEEFPPLVDDREGPELINIYAGRTFRCCFTDRQMARAVVDFVYSGCSAGLQPTGDVWPSLHALSAGASGPWSACAALLRQTTAAPPAVLAVKWQDDPYSRDLHERFGDLFEQTHLPWLDVASPDSERRRVVAPPGRWAQTQVRLRLPHSIGGYYRPNQWEAEAAGQLLTHVPSTPLARGVLVLPAVAAPARRLLRGLTSTAPLVGQRLVVVTGDSLSFNTVYRDAELAWNGRLVPVPLVLFAHQNPIAWDASAGLVPPTGTEDVLLAADLLRLLTSAVTHGLVSADTIAAHWRTRTPAYFAADGNRRAGSGEYVIVLKPALTGDRILPWATLEVWNHPSEQGWQPLGNLSVNYGPGGERGDER
jgi:hypothetical protein